jgi:hypothetical protein
MERWRSSSTILELVTRCRLAVSLTPRLLYPGGKRPRYPLDSRLGEPQSRTGSCGGEKIFFSVLGNEPLARRYTDWAIPAWYVRYSFLAQIRTGAMKNSRKFNVYLNCNFRRQTSEICPYVPYISPLHGATPGFVRRRRPTATKGSCVCLQHADSDNQRGWSFRCGPGELLTTHNKEICILRTYDNESTFGGLRCVDMVLFPKFWLNLSNFGNSAHMRIV